MIQKNTNFKDKDSRIKVSYDKDADVLYISGGSPRRAVCEMMDEGLIVRKDPRTKKVIGFTIVDFSAHFNKAKPQSIPLSARFAVV